MCIAAALAGQEHCPHGLLQLRRPPGASLPASSGLETCDGAWLGGLSTLELGTFARDQPHRRLYAYAGRWLRTHACGLPWLALRVGNLHDRQDSPPLPLTLDLACDAFAGCVLASGAELPRGTRTRTRQSACQQTQRPACIVGLVVKLCRPATHDLRRARSLSCRSPCAHAAAGHPSPVETSRPLGRVGPGFARLGVAWRCLCPLFPGCGCLFLLRFSSLSPLLASSSCRPIPFWLSSAALSLRLLPRLFLSPAVPPRSPLIAVSVAVSPVYVYSPLVVILWSICLSRHGHHQALASPAASHRQPQPATPQPASFASAPEPSLLRPRRLASVAASWASPLPAACRVASAIVCPMAPVALSSCLPFVPPAFPRFSVLSRCTPPYRCITLAGVSCCYSLFVLAHSLWPAIGFAAVSVLALALLRPFLAAPPLLDPSLRPVTFVLSIPLRSLAPAVKNVPCQRREREWATVGPPLVLQRRNVCLAQTLLASSHDSCLQAHLLRTPA